MYLVIYLVLIAMVVILIRRFFEFEDGCVIPLEGMKYFHFFALVKWKRRIEYHHSSRNVSKIREMGNGVNSGSHCLFC